MENFSEQLAALLNRFSRENESNTPDFLLAEYLELCLSAYERITTKRDNWYGIKPSPGQIKQTPEMSIKIHIDTLRELLKKYEAREITVSKMAELLNEGFSSQ